MTDQENPAKARPQRASYALDPLAWNFYAKGPPVDTSNRLYTAEELPGLRDDGWHTELVTGVVLWTPLGGMEHGRIAGNVIVLTGEAAKQHRLSGRSCAGYWIEHDPDTVLALDVSYVNRGRARERKGQEGYPPFAPDWGIEVLAPTDPYTNVTEKIDLLLTAGIGLLWIVDPQRRIVSSYHPSGQIEHRAEDDTIDAGDLLPGWSLPVREIFA